MDITIPSDVRPDWFLFSETLGRFVVTVAPDHKRAFERTLGSEAHLIGRVKGSTLRITGKTTLTEVPVSELEAAYKAPFGRY